MTSAQGDEKRTLHHWWGVVLFLLLRRGLLDSSGPFPLAYAEPEGFCVFGLQEIPLLDWSIGSISIFLRFFCFGTGFDDSLSRCIVRPLQPERVNLTNILTREIWELVQVIPPLPADLHDLVLVCFSLCWEPFAVCMLYHLADILGIHSVEDCKKILAVREPVLRIFILEELIDLRIVFEPGIKDLDRELIVLWHVDLLGFWLWKKLFLPFEHLLDEVAIHRGIRGQK